MYVSPVTGDLVPHLNCSGGDYLSHHNNIYIYIYIYTYWFLCLMANLWVISNWSFNSFSTMLQCSMLATMQQRNSSSPSYV